MTNVYNSPWKFPIFCTKIWMLWYYYYYAKCILFILNLDLWHSFGFIAMGPSPPLYLPSFLLSDHTVMANTKTKTKQIQRQRQDTRSKILMLWYYYYAKCILFILICGTHLDLSPWAALPSSLSAFYSLSDQQWWQIQRQRQNKYKDKDKTLDPKSWCCDIIIMPNVYYSS